MTGCTECEDADNNGAAEICTACSGSYGLNGNRNKCVGKWNTNWLIPVGFKLSNIAQIYFLLWQFTTLDQHCPASNVYWLSKCYFLKAAWLECRRSRVRTTLWHPSFKEDKMLFFRSFIKIQYCGQPPWPRGGVLRLKPQGLDFRIPCMEGSVTLFISSSSGGTPDPVKPILAQRWLQKETIRLPKRQ